MSPVLACVVIEILVFLFLFEVFVLVFLFEIFVLALILLFVFEVFVLVVDLLLFVIELFIERFTCAVGGFLSARRADAILDWCAARTAGGAST
jgi:hypothetical protein